MKTKFFAALFFTAFGLLHAQARLPYQDPKQPIEKRVKDLVGRMTLEEKVSYITGGTLENNQEAIPGIERLSIPNFIIAHGPYGMKMRELVNGKVRVFTGTYFPVSIAMAATWDEGLVEDITAAIGREMKAVGAHANAGPAMNIIRDPRTGRSFEYFTEDPFLNAQITAAYTKGIQSEKIAATLKHYVCNNQELNRHKVDVAVSERALNEIYFPGFKGAVENADAKIIMGAYNKVNGTYSCENDYLLTDVLRKQWGFNGFVLSDWSGTQSTAPSANSGMDLEMPRERYYGKKLLNAVKKGEVTEATIDGMVSNVLGVVFWSGAFDEKPVFDKSLTRTPEHLALARKASAESMVLLKNDGSVLPFDLNKTKKIAVIGPNGDYGKHFRNGIYHIGLLQGGGSAQVPHPKQNIVTPYQGLKDNAKGTEVIYAPGCLAESGCGAIPTKYLTTPDGKEEGMLATYFRNADFKGEPLKVETTKKLSHFWQGELDIPEAGLNMDDKKRFSITFKSKLKAPATRNYIFEVRNEGGFAQLFIDGELVAENKEGNRIQWNDMGSIQLEKGKEYDIVVKFAKRGHRADLTIGWDYENVAYLEEAKKLAETSDAVILTVGLSGQMGETEAGDRRIMELFPAQEKLINEIAKINKNCAVVVVSGSAVAMDNWLERAPAILHAWYPGEQGGNAMADILFGKTNPSGRLPITFAQGSDQYPDDYYSLTYDVDYKHGIYVGYRFFDKYNKKPLFPFGYGLSYTSFEYSDLKVKKKGEKVAVTLKVKNTGKYDGSEVVQLYIHDVKSSTDRPQKELKDFQKVFLKKGESKSVSFTLDDDAFAFWDDIQKKWKVEAGDFEIMIGKSSENIVMNEIIPMGKL